MINYRNLNINDYKFIAKIHAEAFSDFFLTSLGSGFLNTYYKACLRNSESISVGAVDTNGQIKGFCMGCISSKGYHKKLLMSNFHSFLIQGLLILFSKPFSLLRLVRNLEKKANYHDDGSYAEILSIAVSPNCKGSGIGRRMIEKFEEQALNKGCKKIALTTDYCNNQDVLLFYKSSGYTIYYEFSAFPNRKMYKLIKTIEKY